MTQETQPSTKYRDFLDTFSVFTAASRTVAKLELSIQEETDQLLEEHKEEYLKATAALKESEDALIEWAKLNPDWFCGTKTITTPSGKVNKRASSWLEVANEAVTTRLILAQFAPEVRMAALLGDAAEFLHIVIKPNLEALEKLSPKELEDLQVERKKDESITVSPLKIEVGKAIETNTKKGSKKKAKETAAAAA